MDFELLSNGLHPIKVSPSRIAGSCSWAYPEACPWPCAEIKDTLLERGQGFFFFCDGVVQRNAEHSVGALELG